MNKKGAHLPLEKLVSIGLMLAVVVLVSAVFFGGPGSLFGKATAFAKDLIPGQKTDEQIGDGFANTPDDFKAAMASLAKAFAEGSQLPQSGCIIKMPEEVKNVEWGDNKRIAFELAEPDGNGFGMVFEHNLARYAQEAVAVTGIKRCVAAGEGTAIYENFALVSDDAVALYSEGSYSSNVGINKDYLYKKESGDVCFIKSDYAGSALPNPVKGLPLCSEVDEIADSQYREKYFAEFEEYRGLITELYADFETLKGSAEERCRGFYDLNHNDRDRPGWEGRLGENNAVLLRRVEGQLRTYYVQDRHQLLVGSIEGLNPCLTGVKGQASAEPEAFYDNWLDGSLGSRSPEYIEGTLLINGDQKDAIKSSEGKKYSLTNNHPYLYKADSEHICFLPSVSDIGSECNYAEGGIDSDCLSKISQYIPECEKK